MPKNYCNLDALITREDFEVEADPTASTQPSQLGGTLGIDQLERDKLYHQVLRKPDFQRETSNWEPEKIAELVQSFLEGDLIPSVILWRSPRSGNIFVIDGAHRLSAFIAWVTDDYGSGDISTPFFQNFIPPEQGKTGDKTRDLIKNSVGSYIELKTALTRPELVSEDRLRLAKNLSVFALNLQWVQGDAGKAENSFFKINQKATLIDETELAMIVSRRKPNALATRALIRAGTGHKYWSQFPADVRDEIEGIAREVYEMLFRPAMETPIKSLHQPIAGRGYSADSVRMTFELVNYLNPVAPAPDTGAKKRAVKELPDDTDGLATLKYLRAVRRAAVLISGNEPGSLGLHPFVYFYGATGKFQATAFLAAIAFVQELERGRKLPQFIERRAAFEEFLLRHRQFTNQTARRYGSLQRGLPPTLMMYRLILQGITLGRSDTEIIATLQAEAQLRHLSPIDDDDRAKGAAFSRGTKNAVVIREAMESEMRCGVCNARMHFKSFNIDHVKRKEDGGLGTPENAQVTHPYCNSGYKEWLNSRTRSGHEGVGAD